MTLIKTDSMQSRSDQAGNHGNRKGKNHYNSQKATAA